VFQKLAGAADAAGAWFIHTRKMRACEDAGLQFRVSRIRFRVSNKVRISVSDRAGVRVSDGV